MKPQPIEPPIESVPIESADPRNIAEILLGDGLAILPTDTVYGLAALGRSKEARKKLLALKPRPKTHPIGFLISAPKDLEKYQDREIKVPPKARELAAQHWPGGLTIIFERINPSDESDLAAGESEFGESTVAIRCPDYSWLNEVLALTGPLAATSANLHGEPVATHIQSLPPQLAAGVDVIVEAGELSAAPSTIIDLTQDDLDDPSRPQKLRILRSGELKL